jgi:hypothetical protein
VGVSTVLYANDVTSWLVPALYKHHKSIMLTVHNYMQLSEIYQSSSSSRLMSSSSAGGAAVFTGEATGESTAGLLRFVAGDIECDLLIRASASATRASTSSKSTSSSSSSSPLAAAVGCAAACTVVLGVEGGTEGLSGLEAGDFDGEIGDFTGDSIGDWTGEGLATGDSGAATTEGFCGDWSGLGVATDETGTGDVTAGGDAADTYPGDDTDTDFIGDST